MCRNSETPTVLKRTPTLHASAQPSPTMIKKFIFFGRIIFMIS